MNEPQTWFSYPRAVRPALTGLARVVCPPDLEELGLTDAVIDRSQRLVGAMPLALRAGLLAGILGYDSAARLWPGNRGRPARALSPERGRRYFELWWHSRIGVQREFAGGIKGILCIAYYEMPAVRRRLGFTPEARFGPLAARRLQTYSADIERAQRAITEPDPLPGVPASELSRRVG